MLADQTHMLLLVIKGHYTFTDQEQWQLSRHLVPFHSLSGPPNDGVPEGWDTNTATVHRTETDWTIDSDWLLTDLGDVFQPDDYLNDHVANGMSTIAWGKGQSNKTRVDSLTLYPVKSNGRVNDDRKTVLTWSGSHPTGSMTGNMIAMEDAIAVSFGTSATGRKGRGRVFLPSAGVSVFDTDGFIDSTVASDVRDEWVMILEYLSQNQLFTALRWFVRPVVCPAVPSRYSVIQDVRVGNVVDRQVRRRKGIPETYNAPATPTYP